MQDCRKTALKEAFTALMTADSGAVADAVDRLAARLREESQQRQLSPKEALVLRLNEQYPQVRRASGECDTSSSGQVAVKGSVLRRWAQAQAWADPARVITGSW